MMNETETAVVETISTTRVETNNGRDVETILRLRWGEFKLTALHGDSNGESWHRSAVLSGPFPAPPTFAECDRATARFPGRNCSTRLPCDTCYDQDDWESAILDIVATMTQWSLYSFGLNSAHMTGRAFGEAAYVTPKPGGRVKVTQSGGLDV